MNKKFLSAIMCGALLTASTSVFVSCEDYGDDIAHLQEQIDQNATTAASELAAKVAALESQLSTLKAAQENMKEQLAAAKADAAAAANNALLAAQAAQAAADKAQGGADDAKAAAAAAQAAADAAAKNLSDAVTRVAVLEAKIASLEATAAELAASNKELSGKLNDLQLAFNSLSTTVGSNSAAIGANAEEIKAIKADIVKQVAALEAQITAVSTAIGGQIDAINADLNAIKANYATKGELNETAANLAAVAKKLDEQIAANAAYVAQMETVIAGLEAKDAEAAALIASNYESTMAEIAKVNEALATQKAAVEAEFVTVKAQLADLEATVATLAQQATANYEDIASLRQVLEERTLELYDLVAQLTSVDKGLNDQIQIIFEKLFDVETTASDNADLISQLIGADKGFASQIETILVNLDALNTAAADAADQIAQLIGADKGFAAQIEALLVDYTQNKEDVADLISQLIGTDKGFAAQIEALLVDYTQNKEEVADLISQLIGADKGMAAQIEALLVDYDQHKIDAEELISQLAATDRGLASQIEELLVDYDKNKNDVAELISQLAATDRGFAAQIEEMLVNIDSINGVTATQIAQLFAADETLNAEIEKLIDEDQKLNAAIEGVNKAISALEAKDAQLAAQIEAIIAQNAVLGGDLKKAQDDIKALQDDLAAKYDEVKAQIVGILANVAAQGGQIDDILKDIDGIEENYAVFKGQFDATNADYKSFKDAYAQFLADYEEAYNAHIAQYGQLAANHEELEAVVEALKTLVGANKDAADKAVADLDAKFADNLKNAIAGVTAQIDAINTWKEEFVTSYNATIQGINDELGKLANANALLDQKYADIVAGINGRLDELEGNVDNLQNDVTALLSRLQSVVFIPQYQDKNNVVITPIFTYTAPTYKADGKTAMEVPAIFKMNFRVKPASLVADFVAMVTEGKANVNIYVEEALQTRAADKTSVEVLEVVADTIDKEVITVTATAPRLAEEYDEDAYFPATLVITDENSKSEFTTEYFNLVEREIRDLKGEIFPNDGIKVIENTDTLDICYVHIDTVRNVLAETHVVYPEAISAIYSQNLKFFGGYIDGTLYKYSDAEAWKKFLDEAMKLGFEFHANAYTFEAAETKDGHAIHANIGNHITLAVADETFGFDATGKPNAEYRVAYKITEATADRAYDFGTVSKVWDPVTGSAMFALLDTIALETFTVEGVNVATPEQLEVALKDAVAKGTYAATSDVNFSYTFKDGKAIIKYIFPEKTNYAKEGGYNHAITFSTEYGKVDFVGHVSLAYPTDFLVHEPRFTEGVTGKFIVEAGNQVIINSGVPAYRDGLVGSSLPAAYTNYALYTKYSNVDYDFSFTGASNEELALGTKNFSGHSVYEDYLSVLKELENEEGVVITVKVTVDGHEVASESYGIDVLYPVEGRNLRLNGASSEDNKQTILASSLYNSQTVSVIGNVYLDDRYENELFKDGVAVDRNGSIDTNAKVWGITGLEYELVNAYSASGHKVTSVSVDKAGNLSIVDPNISEDVTVLVRVKTVGYTYGVVDGTFEVLIKKTYGEYDPNK